ncbi:fibronectin type III-like domain-contianing protein, partial [Reichenbachiella sp.]|uniref:fibronectin type III-like domain-contianing protein n=1 Tax=Reichenbachiella sp. TaxID=2184521 RepID=UPI003B5CCB6A
GNAVAMPWLPKAKGLIQAWYLGSMTGHALADVVSGDVNPSGKLPFSFSKKLEDNGAHSFGEISYPGDSIMQEYKEDILVGYRWHDTKRIASQFAFGYGLSYSEFSISNVRSDQSVYAPNESIIVSFDIKNTGAIEGAEVVQVYVGKIKSKVPRALKELKGYQKLKLEPGTSKSGQVIIDVADLAYYDESTAEWVVESGDYYLHIGNASDNMAKKIKISIRNQSKS